jgi:hypothetical protein
MPKKKDMNLKPSDIIKANKAKTQEQKDKETENREYLELISEKRLEMKRDNLITNTICKTPDSIFKMENECYEKEDKVDYKKINDMLEMIFKEHINDLYNSLSKTDNWYDNVREFINFHKDMNIKTEDYYEYNDTEIDEIKTNGFQYFVGDKCADIDEDEIDGLNDLSIEEWENVDEIILYYYHKYN